VEAPDIVNNIFITFTPYHNILSYSIALKHQKYDNNFLFIISDFFGANNLSNFFKASKSIPFRKVSFLPGLYKEKNRFKRRFIIKNNIKILKSFIDKQHIDNIYVFHDGRPESQFTLYYARKRYKGSIGTYIEDGAGAYSSKCYLKRKKFTLFVEKIFYGFWWRDISVLGTSSLVDQVISIFPKFIRPELKTKRLIALKKEDFLKISKEEIFRNYINLLNTKINDMQTIDVLLIVANSEFIKKYPKYFKIIEKILTTIKFNNLRLMLKYHPREDLEDFLPIINKEEVFILPKTLPLELLYILNIKLPRLIIGDISTALLTARWLLRDTNIVSIAPLLNYSDYNLFKMFRSNNIKLINNEEEFEKILK